MAPRLGRRRIVGFTTRLPYSVVLAFDGLCGVRAAGVSDNALLICPSRRCLPEDPSQGGAGLGTLCFTNTGREEAFAQCDDQGRPHCTKCTTTPPCESWCEADTYEPLLLGSWCHLDHECGGTEFAGCHLGLCRRILWAGQRCSADVNTVCLYGAQQCTDGLCQGLGSNEPCWDGYPGGLDLDCKMGWYCLRARCVPQLPNGHTCRGEHPNECLTGHRCNLKGSRPHCTAEYSLPEGVLSSDPQLCRSSHIDPRTDECAEAIRYNGGGGECYANKDCALGDGSYGTCKCKQWWNGVGAPGFCEFETPDIKKPSFMALWALMKAHCHHNWSEERCAIEIGEQDLLMMVQSERRTTADPTLPIPTCAKGFIPVYVSVSAGTSQWAAICLVLNTWIMWDVRTPP